MGVALLYCHRCCCISDNNTNDIWIKRKIANFIQFQSWAAQRPAQMAVVTTVYTGVYMFAGLNSSFCGFQFLLLID